MIRFACLGGGGGAAWSRFPLPGLGLRAPRRVVAGVVTRHQPCRTRSCELALSAVGATRGCLGGAPLALVWGALGVGRSPTPDNSSFRACGQGPLPTGCGCGGAGVGTRHQPHTARSCELALRAVGAARGRPGGAPLAWVWGVRGRALSNPRPLVLSGVRPGPTTHWLWVRGCGCGGPSPTPPHVLL